MATSILILVNTLYLSFVDFTNAFDSVDRERLWRLLRHYGVPTKIEKVMTGTCNNFRAQVANNTKLSDPFEIRLEYGKDVYYLHS